MSDERERNDEGGEPENADSDDFEGHSFDEGGNVDPGNFDEGGNVDPGNFDEGGNVDDGA